jgi:hypothetical protein
MTRVQNPQAGDDLYRMLLQDPPSEADPAAHLVWLRLVSRPIKELAELAPLGVIALCAHPEGLALIGDFGREQQYERAIAEGRPLGRALLSHLAAQGTATHVVDVIRTEAWLTVSKLNSPDRNEWASCVNLRDMRGRTFLTASHDTLSSLQTLIAWQETTLGRCGHLLWLLGIAPIKPVLTPNLQPGIVTFVADGADIGAAFLPLAE